MEKYLLPQRLKSLREDKGLSQYNLAKSLGYSRGQIANYEQGTRRPDPDTLQRLADFFNVSVDYLLGRANDPSTPSWWHRNTPPTDIELEEFLKSANIYFDGAPLNEEDKEDILTYLKVKWEREKKKREKGKG